MAVSVPKAPATTRSRSNSDKVARLSFVRGDRQFWLMVVTAICALVVIPKGTTADPESFGEYEVKAAFLYNFAKFVEWPAEAFPGDRTPILLGIMGEDPFGGALEQAVEGKSINGREILLRRIDRQQDLTGFHILFVSASETQYLGQIMDGLEGKWILTVGDTEGFAQAGGVINFTLEESRVRFEINVDRAEHARLKISSKLLNLAKVVKDERPHSEN